MCLFSTASRSQPQDSISSAVAQWAGGSNKSLWQWGQGSVVRPVVVGGFLISALAQAASHSSQTMITAPQSPHTRNPIGPVPHWLQNPT